MLKILAERLKKVLPKIINTEQKGFAKGRNIFDGNRLLHKRVLRKISFTTDTKSSPIRYQNN
jgi:hypothetical protein